MSVNSDGPRPGGSPRPGDPRPPDPRPPNLPPAVLDRIASMLRPALLKAADELTTSIP